MMCHCRRRAIYWLLRSPLANWLKPKLKSGAGRYQLLSRWWDAYRKQLAWKTSLRKVRTLWHCSRLRSVALYLWLIVVISVRQSTVAAISGASPPGAGYGCLEHKADSLIAKFKEAGDVREIGCMSRVTAIIPGFPGYLHHRLFLLLIITVITPLPTKPSATKCQRISYERGNYWHADASAMLLRSMQQNTRRS